MERNCYTYFLKWSDGKMYYGCRYAKGCDPSDLWESYFTSSEYIPKETPTVIKVTRVFGENVSDCRNHESRFLKKVGAVKSDMWYNRTDIDNFYNDKPHSDKTKQKISDSLLGIKYSEERNKKVSDSLRGRTLSEEHRKNIAKATSGRIGGMTDKKHTNATKKKMSESAKKRKPNAKGTIWITNGIIRKRIHKDDNIPHGFKRGSKIDNGK